MVPGSYRLLFTRMFPLVDPKQYFQDPILVADHPEVQQVVEEGRNTKVLGGQFPYVGLPRTDKGTYIGIP
jgi:hypothetical protein